MRLRLFYISESRIDDDIRGWFVDNLMMVKIMDDGKTDLGYWSQIVIHRMNNGL